MNFTPLFPLFDHLWQSTVFAAAAGLFTLTLRKNRARVRHGLWLAASVKFLLPFSLLIAAGSHIYWPRAEQAATANWSAVMVGVSEPFAAPIPASPPPSVNRLPGILLAVWTCGFLAIAGSWWVRWRRLAAVVRAGSPVDLDLPIAVRVSATLVEPGVFGIVRPVLLLPAGIRERLTPEQLDTVIAHELYHVWHRDNLAAAFHMFVETAFWFHPLVWWIGKRLVEERERACDEGVLNTGSEPRVYAEAVLKVCKLYVESPLRCVAGITGANLKRRIEAIMTRRAVRELQFSRKLALVAAGVAAVTLPLLIGMIHSPVVKAQSATAPVPVHEIVPVAQAAIAPQPAAQAAIAPKPAPAAPIQVVPPAQPAGTNSFTNSAMNAVYKQYGPADQIEDRDVGGAPVQIWRYNYLEAYHSNAEFEFPTKARVAGRINWPQQTRFEGSFPPVLTVENLLASVLLKDGGDPSQRPAIAALAGRHTAIEPSVRLNRVEQLFNLSIPLDAFSGRVDIIGDVLDEYGTTVMNLRDNLQAAPGGKLTYSSAFVLIPGSYVCHVLVREQATGLMFAEAIEFRMTKSQ